MADFVLSGNDISFPLLGDVYTAIAPPDAVTTDAYTVNNVGQVAGTFKTASSYLTRSFIATPH